MGVPHVLPYVHMALQGFRETHVCLMGVGVVTDLCYSLQAKILPFVDEFVNIMCTHLQNPDVDRKIQAAIMTTIGDVALTIGGDFEKFLTPVIQIMQQAATTRFEDGPGNDED